MTTKSTVRTRIKEPFEFLERGAYCKRSPEGSCRPEFVTGSKGNRPIPRERATVGERISKRELDSEGFAATIFGRAAERQTCNFAQQCTCVPLRQTAPTARWVPPISSELAVELI